MRLKAFAVLASLTIVAALALAALPLGVASALQGATPTVPPLGDLVIPTATPGGVVATPTTGGFSIPTATPGGLAGPTATSSGGFVIPTSTPVPTEASGPSLGVLTGADLTTLNLQPGDVPAEFAASQAITNFSIQETLDALNAATGYEEAATLLQSLAATYGWDTSVGISYTACYPNIPIGKIYSEVIPLGSPDLARQFINDPRVAQFNQALGYTLGPSTTLHGWRTALPPEDGACFEEEIEYGLYFEYWGLLIILNLQADANTDPALVYSLLDQLAPIIVAKVDAFAGEPFPATPVPGTVANPTALPAGPSATPTLDTLLPPPASLTPTGTTAAVDTGILDEVDAVMPGLEEIGLPADIFAVNDMLSGVFLPSQIVGIFQSANMTGVALAVGEEMARDGQIGTVIRVWDTGEACPDTVGLSVEIDVAVYGTAAGALASLTDAGTQQAWIEAGTFHTFTPTADGGILATGAWEHQCGPISYYSKSLAHGRFAVSVTAISNPDTDSTAIVGALDQLTSYTISKLDTAGLQ